MSQLHGSFNCGSQLPLSDGGKILWCGLGLCASGSSQKEIVSHTSDRLHKCRFAVQQPAWVDLLGA
jgi:hypothetical protein